MKERKDFIKIRARGASALGGKATSAPITGLYGPNYEYDFRDGKIVEVLRRLFESPRFADIRSQLEIVEDPVIVRDPKPRTKE